jgi:hypothetical protein
MPNLTLSIRSEDWPLVEQAKELAPRGLSALFVDGIRAFIEKKQGHPHVRLTLGRNLTREGGGVAFHVDFPGTLLVEDVVAPADVDNQESGATNFFLYHGDGGFLLVREDWRGEFDAPGVLTRYADREALRVASLEQVLECRRANGEPMIPEDRARTLVEVARDALTYKAGTP